MSERNLDAKGRWRNVTIAFRVSPEENADINMRVKLSGLTKQDYITTRCQERDVVVAGNPRVYKALRDEMAQILQRLQGIQQGRGVDPYLQETIRMVSVTLGEMNREGVA